ncbi:hypothetical protein HYQ45_013953 [Verticillium longisporum]|uniref:Histone chaperone domain-containing protein n=1 Tax=Verticillium longisporum TaxID=100787 RepID=A0A0G4N7G1_VERLO|nr:hypothetical protein HYQ44_007634 [Verticillium longisporum]KAG7123310.1 hypothetical protein HYQ45_013953 [Verticillium longisporum]CRK23579.1 hypothetical protein BN1723_013030 [Verticillium longisporum]CRK42269.1 hypothetical protein BN1708_008728 [Verticillium longisporum]
MSDSYNNDAGVDVKDDEYVSRQAREPISVQSDDAKIEDPIGENTADSDAQLERDDKDAINPDNMIDERTRSAKPEGSYREPGDEEGLPGPEDGTSQGRA